MKKKFKIARLVAGLECENFITIKKIYTGNGNVCITYIL